MCCGGSFAGVIDLHAASLCPEVSTLHEQIELTAPKERVEVHGIYTFSCSLASLVSRLQNGANNFPDHEPIYYFDPVSKGRVFTQTLAIFLT
ncbi:uncharacterized protein FOMMEDRAFT_20319 [Fomitiporia mediterranea MF3/22]|uniref:uncharacterized protein n=1 Tax=Fomitiporia mediterranea (strain MF3/22) TaxID=694068 RepID=UPI0004409A79|nr:uncharacterized protein FOMMEDRAFT_20319 [Fomitiporia mediterranea MF3/22]EJD03159.1 hypothetical protein FOMMEDRAFT_20319 [Fomitiporia mediterranea MF3/22]